MAVVPLWRYGRQEVRFGRHSACALSLREFLLGRAMRAPIAVSFGARSQVSVRAHVGCACNRKSFFGCMHVHPGFASSSQGARRARPCSRVVFRAHSACARGRKSSFVFPSGARSGCRAREEHAVASRRGLGLPRGGFSGRARTHPGSRHSIGRRWAETPFGEASFVRVPVVPSVRRRSYGYPLSHGCAPWCARPWGGRVQRGIAPAPRAMLWHVEWCERNGRRTSAIRARTIARHSWSRREWRRRGLIGTFDGV